MLKLDVILSTHTQKAKPTLNIPWSHSEFWHWLLFFIVSCSGAPIVSVERWAEDQIH